MTSTSPDETTDPLAVELDTARLGSRRTNGKITLEVHTNNPGDHAEALAELVTAIARITYISGGGVNYDLVEQLTTTTHLDNAPF